MSLIGFNFQEFEEILETADRNGYRIRAGTSEAESYPFDHGIDIELVRQKMNTLTYPKIAIISNGSGEGMYLYSLKDKVCFYCETNIEINKRKELDKQKEEKIKTTKIISYILLALLGFLGIHRFYLASVTYEDEIKNLAYVYMGILGLSFFIMVNDGKPIIGLILLLPLYLFDIFRIPFLAKRIY